MSTQSDVLHYLSRPDKCYLGGGDKVVARSRQKAVAFGGFLFYISNSHIKPVVGGVLKLSQRRRNDKLGLKFQV